MTEPYRVLARRYRPQILAEVIGQEIAVRTLTRALSTGRLAHAYLLTGVRGVGKTTIARILARGLCCDTGPTASPCGECDHCVAIADDNHPDVTEVDAASKTGIDDVREIIDGARYAPVRARYRVWIIDEVHMLSRNAFNAMLKTLEEPPPEVVFVFATTDPQKLPTTIVSRCQRHDLRRVPTDVLVDHYAAICRIEDFRLETEALAALARAAAGSVRDGLSLLDAAMTDAEDHVIRLTQVERMLGIADRGRVEDLLTLALSGDAPRTLDAYSALYEAGADPLALASDLLDEVLNLTRASVADQTAGVGKLARAWQMLLRGVGEVRDAPRPEQALEMLLIRLCYVSDMPTPAELLASLMNNP
jgi:DNA polymerase-3 subunit gamma/tau